MRIVIAAAVLTCVAAAVQAPTTTKRASGVTRATTGAQVDGKPVEIFTLTNASGSEIKAITYGAIITSWRVPDRTGQMADVVLGFNDAAEYIKNNSPYFGAIVGRYGN